VLYRHSEIFRTLLIAADLGLVVSSWLAAYWIRFHTGFEAPSGVPEFRSYVEALVAIVPLWFLLFRAHGLYEPHRTRSIPAEAIEVLRATAVGVVVLVTLSFFARSYYYSRTVTGLFFALSGLSVWTFRASIRLLFRQLRRRGHNLRYLMVVGAGELAAQVIDRIHANPDAGLRVRLVLACDGADVPSTVSGVPVAHGYGHIREVLARDRVDQVILALPRDESHHLEKILTELQDDVVSVKLVPDLLHVMTLKSSVEDLNGLPIIGLRESPLLGWSAVGKRAFDLSLSIAMLPMLVPLMGAVALAIRISNGRPIFYFQERMGLDARVFRMFKFRTMTRDAEARSGPVWTTSDDPRRTALGAILRRTGLDELPQIWNVLRGDMSLVGPRPERPIFIEQFRSQIPGYMLRHKIKAGIAGWAQLHGWRGDTCLRERVAHDTYYIQNWSIWLDLQILLMTAWRLFRQRNAY
jgi:Undecaprenyl-phosphate glucose phosphotransferase